MTRLLPIALFAGFLSSCNCGHPASQACTHDSDCTGGKKCRSGACITAGTGDAGTGDAGDFLQFPDAGAGCDTPCGFACCASGEVCEADGCHLDCGATARCEDQGAEKCCAASEICYLSTCVTPGPACATSAQCQKGEYCDPAILKCLAVGDKTCEYHPPAGTFNPGSLWHYAVATDSYTQVMMTPMVIDVNGDGTPDVLASFFAVATGYNGPGVMRALSGDDGHLLWTSADTAAEHVHPPASIAAGILVAGGPMLAITVAATGNLIAFDAKTGTKLWTSHTAAGADAPCAANWGGPSIADLDGDGKAEIVCGLTVFDQDGALLWDNGVGGGAIGPLSTVADLDGDGKLEVSDGAHAYRSDGSAMGWTGAGAKGFPATGDFLTAAGALGRDGAPELVVVNAGTLALVNGQTGELLAGPALLPSWNGTDCVQDAAGKPGNGGPPTVADFDGDGRPEVGAAGQDCYSMFKLALDAASKPVWQVMWSKKVQDHSSSVTGSSVFDFEGDGPAEVVYADEVRLHVFRGSDGAEIFSRPHCSGTTYEYPVIVDVNGNGRADIVISENTYAATGLGCDAAVTAGIQVFHDALDNWVNTRAIWNEHTYHVTNVCDGADLVCGGPGAADNVYGRIPKHEPKNWAFTNLPVGVTAPPLNNYRQNVQGEGLFYAPDLLADKLSHEPSVCPGQLKLLARVVNKGALGVLAGVNVAFYNADSHVLLGVVQTQGRLLPGQTEVVALLLSPAPTTPINVKVVVDDDGTGKGAVSECREGNNTFGPVSIDCTGPT